MTYDELKKLATPGVLSVSRDPGSPSSGRPAAYIIGNDKVEISSDIDSKADARLLVHCYNHFDEVLSALERIMRLTQLGSPTIGVNEIHHIVGDLVARARKVEAC